jgi:uncharacterized protein (DUF2147 family)
MKPSHLTEIAAFAALSIALPSGAHAASDPKGVWLDDSGRGAIEIKSCGAALCGYVVAVKSASDTKGCGKQIIGEAQASGGGLWNNGWIYSPERRKNYDVELKPLSDGTLRVVGYAGTKLFSRTMIWTRAPADLKRCDVVEAKAPEATAQSSGPQPVAPPTATIPAAPSIATTPTLPGAAPGPSVTVAPPAQPGGAGPSGEPAKSTSASPPGSSATAPSPSPSSNDRATTKSAQSEADEADDDTAAGEQPGQRTSGGLKLGDLQLDKVLTRTKTGKCKLDLPWVKVQFDCERD